MTSKLYEYTVSSGNELLIIGKVQADSLEYAVELIKQEQNIKYEQRPYSSVNCLYMNGQRVVIRVTVED